MEVPAGQVNFRGSLPRSENNVLQPMLHPDDIILSDTRNNFGKIQLDNYLGERIGGIKTRKWAALSFLIINLILILFDTCILIYLLCFPG